jgi:phosphohistidine phosphatase
MLTLWLARHGEAADPDTAPSDFDRALTEKGRRELSAAARWLLEREAPPELILHSPLVRARQTAETIAVECGLDPRDVRVENALAPGIDLDELLRRVAGTVVERILCVGHQPDMSRCLAGMIGGGDIHYSPGTIAAVDFTGPIIRHGGHLRWLTRANWFSG